MSTGLLFKHRASLACSLPSIACLAWCFFVDLKTGPVEACRVLAGLTCLWAPIGSLVYLLLRDRCADTVTRLTLSATASFALTGPAYLVFGLGGLLIPGFERMFYVAQATTFAGVLVYAVRHKLLWRAADLLEGFCKLDWALILLVSLSILVGNRYKTTFERMPEEASQRLAVHGDATYLASLAYELDRQTPAAQQPARAGLKERAYHMFPHLNTMLIARYTGQPEMLRALMHYHFTVVEVLLCLAFFCIAHRLTASRAAGYLAVMLVYILAIPLPPIGRHAMWYFYFTWYTHATSNLEPVLLASPQTYCSLPVVFGILLFVLQLSIAVSHKRAAGTLAVLAGLMAAVLLRFRIQSFVILFPGLITLFAIAWHRTRQRIFVTAGWVASLVVTAQILEMQLPLYYPATASLQIGNNYLGHDCVLMNAWPGAEWLRESLERNLGPDVFGWAWQVVCLGMFALVNIAGIPVGIAGCFHFLRRSTWRADTWAFSALIAWLTVGTVVGATCLNSSYDRYSVGGQSLFLIGWYLLPLLAVGIWQVGLLLSSRLSVPRGYAAAAVALMLLAACGWQRARPATPIQNGTFRGGTVFSGDEWAAMQYMHVNLPADAVILSKVSHHQVNYCNFSGIVGRRAFVEYYNMAGYTSGAARDQTDARDARIARVWCADNAAEFSAAVRDTGATHLVEYAEHPLPLHFSECLEEFWSSPTGTVKVWTFRRLESPESALRMEDLVVCDPHRTL